MNVELLSKLRDRFIREGDSGCDMDCWITGEELEDEFVEVGERKFGVINGLSDKEANCGTAGCIAGWAAVEATGALMQLVADELAPDGFKDYNDYFLLGNGKLLVNNPAIENWATNELGISSRYFHEGQWPEKYQKIYQNEGSAKGMVAIIDGLLDGTLDANDIYKYEEEWDEDE